jgi:hypothetical protein
VRPLSLARELFVLSRFCFSFLCLAFSFLDERVYHIGIYSGVVQLVASRYYVKDGRSGVKQNG